MSKHRGHEQHEIEDIVDMDDHISNLPNCILNYILSFMPTKEVVKTSVLSTRWKNLWASVPNIDFDDDLLLFTAKDDVMRLSKLRSFKNFVERGLRLRDASNMKRFCLSCRVFHDPIQIHSWISDAIMHNVQELDICLREVGASVIPRSMFDSTSLVILKIIMDCAIQLPSHVSLPCLKTLYLSYVKIPTDDFTEKLFSGCPVLEELVLRECRWMNLKNIAISSSTLKSLTIRDLSRFEVFNDPTGRCKMKIDAANLIYFKYDGYLRNNIILNNTPSLDKSFIHISNPGGSLNEVTRRAFDLLNQLQYVVSLSLSNNTMVVIGKLLYIFAASIRLPVFPNLIHLMATITHLMPTKEIGLDLTFFVFMRLLSCCPVLQSICFSEGFFNSMHLGENSLLWPSIPKCISNSLETVTLKGFHGYDSEVCFLKFVFKYARVLERMDILWSKTELHDVKRNTKVRKELENIERSSTACVIKFS